MCLGYASALTTQESYKDKHNYLQGSLSNELFLHSLEPYKKLQFIKSLLFCQKIEGKTV